MSVCERNDMNNNFQVPFTQFQVHRNMVYGTQVIEQVIKVERGEKGLEVKLCSDGIGDVCHFG